VFPSQCPLVPSQNWRHQNCQRRLLKPNFLLSSLGCILHERSAWNVLRRYVSHMAAIGMALLANAPCSTRVFAVQVRVNVVAICAAIHGSADHLMMKFVFRNDFKGIPSGLVCLSDCCRLNIPRSSVGLCVGVVQPETSEQGPYHHVCDAHVDVCKYVNPIRSLSASFCVHELADRADCSTSRKCALFGFGWTHSLPGESFLSVRTH